jgi:hypothetical protein
VEGSVYWDSDGDVLTVGDGAARKTLLNTDSAIDGEYITADTIDDDSIDFGTGADQVDLADIPGGAASASVFDFGGATSVELPNSDDPDLTVTGQISYDTDGWLRLTSDNGTTQKAVQVNEPIVFTAIKPQDWADAARDAFPIYTNTSGMIYTVTAWTCKSAADNTDLNVETTDGTGATNATVDAVSITTDGTGLYYATDATITAGTIANGSIIWIDFDDTDDPAWVTCTIDGYYNANVN